MFDEIIIGIGINSSKNYYFEIDKRLKHITEIYKSTTKIKVQTYQKLTIEFCKDVHASYILRGLRDTKDFEYEKAIAQMNLQISGIETVFFMTEPSKRFADVMIPEGGYNSVGIDLISGRIHAQVQQELLRDNRP